MKKKLVLCCFLAFLVLCSAPDCLFAANIFQDASNFSAGAQRVLLAPFQLPVYLLRGLMSPFPPLGIVQGALVGTVRTVGELINGVFVMAGSAAPYAKYAAFA